MLSLVSASLEALFFFSHPLASPLVSLPFSYRHKCVFGQVSVGRVSVRTQFSQNSCSTKFFIQVKLTPVYYHAVSLTCVYNQTHSLKARLWEVSQPFPNFQKECGALHAFCVELENAHELILAANVGPRAQ